MPYFEKNRIFFAPFPVYKNRMKKEEIEMLFRQYYSQMIRLARRLLYDDEESRDVVSEVFITLINTDILSKNMEDYLIASFFMLITYNHA